MRPLLLSLMISAFTSGIAAFRRLNRSYFQLYSPRPLLIETQLNFKSYFLQFVLCQYVKDLLDSNSPRGDSGIEPKLQPFLLNLYIYKQFRVQEALGSSEPDFLISFFS